MFGEEDKTWGCLALTKMSAALHQKTKERCSCRQGARQRRNVWEDLGQGGTVGGQGT